MWISGLISNIKCWIWSSSPVASLEIFWEIFFPRIPIVEHGAINWMFQVREVQCRTSCPPSSRTTSTTTTSTTTCISSPSHRTRPTPLATTTPCPLPSALTITTKQGRSLEISNLTPVVIDIFINDHRQRKNFTLNCCSQTSCLLELEYFRKIKSWLVNLNKTKYVI